MIVGFQARWSDRVMPEYSANELCVKVDMYHRSSRALSDGKGGAKFSGGQVSQWFANTGEKCNVGVDNHKENI